MAITTTIYDLVSWVITIISIMLLFLNAKRIVVYHINRSQYKVDKPELAILENSP
jgi:hypothetical protein